MKPTRDLTLPDGCIHPEALRGLAVAMEKLNHYHHLLNGTQAAIPCLRRIEVTPEGIVAHISTGAAVDGDWYQLVLSSEDGWVMQ